MKLRDVIAAHDNATGPNSIRDVVGDGYLYAANPFARRVRDAALSRGYRFVPDKSSYFGFPLLGLEALLDSRLIPHRCSMPPLRWLEDKRPDFFKLKDLDDNRPAPNYLLHESAHAVAFRQVFGQQRAAIVFADPDCLPGTFMGEAFAMTAEYFAACAVRGKLHRWFFSISSYRHRVPAKKAIAHCIDALGPEPVVLSVLLGFVLNNHLVEPLKLRHLERIAALMPSEWREGAKGKVHKQLLAAQNRLMVMSPEFRTQTARLFLTTYGRDRDLRRSLSDDPLAAFEESDALTAHAHALTRLLCGSAD